jgi:hypothetical protein
MDEETDNMISIFLLNRFILKPGASIRRKILLSIAEGLLLEKVVPGDITLRHRLHGITWRRNWQRSPPRHPIYVNWENQHSGFRTLDEDFQDDFLFSDDERFREYFMFRKAEVMELAKRFKLPEIVIVGHSKRLSAQWAVVLFLQRMQGETEKSVGKDFGMHRNDVSKHFNFMLTTVLSFDKIVNIPLHPNRQQLLDNRLEGLVRAVAEKSGIPVDVVRIWVFLDGTSCEICRPTFDCCQRAMFDGHHHQHAFAAMVTNLANGMIPYITKAYRGNDNDMNMQQLDIFEDLIHVFYANGTYHVNVNTDSRSVSRSDTHALVILISA